MIQLLANRQFTEFVAPSIQVHSLTSSPFCESPVSSNVLAYMRHKSYSVGHFLKAIHRQEY